MKIEIVIDYFNWRQADAQRNSLNSHFYNYLNLRALYHIFFSFCQI